MFEKGRPAFQPSGGPLEREARNESPDFRSKTVETVAPVASPKISSHIQSVCELHTVIFHGSVFASGSNVMTVSAQVRSRSGLVKFSE